MESQRKPSPFLALLAKYMPMVERVLLVAFAAGLVIQMMTSNTSLILVSLTGLAAVYYFSAYIPLEIPDDGKRGFMDLLTRTIVPKILSIASAVSVIGILFYLLHLNGYKQMVFIGCLSLMVVLLISIFTILSNEPARNAMAPRLFRAVPLAIICFYILIKEGLN